MSEILEQMQVNATNGYESFCYISEKKLEAMKTLARKEKEELEQLQKENKEQQKILNEFIDYTNKNPKVLQNSFFLDMRMKLSKGDK